MSDLCNAGVIEKTLGIQLPRFESEQAALVLATPKLVVPVNRSDHFEVSASSTPSFVLEVSHWRDTSNELGLALGPLGTQVWRAMGGGISFVSYPNQTSMYQCLSWDVSESLFLFGPVWQSAHFCLKYL